MCGIVLEMLKAGGEVLIGTAVDRVLQYGLESGCGSCMVIGRMQLYKKAAEWNAQITE